jgi:16S rRNA (cytidine1402-2'-O)-methyltransferase
VRGEVTIVVAGTPGGPSIDNDEHSLRDAVARREEAGMSRKDAIAEVARQAGVPKREVYNLVHAHG